MKTRIFTRNHNFENRINSCVCKRKYAYISAEKDHEPVRVLITEKIASGDWNAIESAYIRGYNEKLNQF